MRQASHCSSNEDQRHQSVRNSEHGGGDQAVQPLDKIPQDWTIFSDIVSIRPLVSEGCRHLVLGVNLRLQDKAAPRYRGRRHCLDGVHLGAS